MLLHWAVRKYTKIVINPNLLGQALLSDDDAGSEKSLLQKNKNVSGENYIDFFLDFVICNTTWENELLLYIILILALLKKTVGFSPFAK